MSERICLLWGCPHCGHRNIAGTTIQGTALKGSKQHPLRFDCKFSGCTKRVRIQDHIIAATNPAKRHLLKRLAEQLDVGKTEIDAAKIWDPEGREGEALPFAFRRWKKWIGAV